jgi:pantoate--beta-alanine ligase
MWTSTTIADLRRQRHGLRGTVAFVPTMGALHAGHASLMQAGLRLADHVIVSIFVNPTQFGPHEDFHRYPRPLERDLALCERTGVAGVFHPSVEEMYPPGQPECVIEVPAVAAELEGALRPGHFRGVCRVVAKLLNIVQPDVACFGRKDYQQLKVVEAMVADLALPLRVVGLLTVREADGLALSSRNAYLNAEQRRHAVGLFKALSEARAMVEERGETDPATVEAAIRMVVQAHQMQVDYAVMRHPQTLATLDSIDPPLTGGAVALVAARLGLVRLIDNMLLGEQASQK